MFKRPSAAEAVCFLPVALALAVYTVFLRAVPGYDIIDHAFSPHPLLLLLLAAAFLLILAVFRSLYSSGISRLFSLDPVRIRREDAFSYLPLALLILTPFSLRHYIGRGDIRERAGIFLAVCLGLVFCIKAVQILKWKSEEFPAAPPRFAAVSRLPLRTKLILLFVSSLAVFNLGAHWMSRKGINFSGDEPHYLMMTHSLLRDGDLDLADNYARRDYRAYMPEVPLDPHVVPGRKAGSQYSFHSPGTSFFLFPFYAVGFPLGKPALVFIIRFAMSLIGALFGLQVFLYGRRAWSSEKTGFLLWILMMFTSPLFFYSIHVYPEIIIALFSLTAFRLLSFPEFLTKGKILLAGILLSSFIWFHALKYIFILGPLFLYGLWILIKKRRSWPEAVLFAASSLSLTALYFFFQFSLYGSLSLSAVSWKGSLKAGETVSFLKSLFADIPFHFRWETLAGYFLDQKDGLLLYAPIYFFSILGMVEAFRKKARDFWPALFVTAPYVLVSAFLTQRTGYAPQARPLVAVMWGMGIFLGHFLTREGKGLYARLLAWAAAASYLVTWLLLQNPFHLYQETTAGTSERGGGLFYLLSNFHFRLTDFLPSFIKIDNSGWLPNYIWPAGCLLFIILYACLPPRKVPLRPGRFIAGAPAGGLVVFAWLVLYPRIVLLNPVKTAFPAGEKVTFYSLSRVARQVEPGKFLLPEDGRSYIFWFSSWREFRRMEMEFGSLEGDYEVEIGLFDRPLFQGETRRETRSLELPNPPRYVCRGASYYRVTISITKRSEVSTARNPYLFSLVPAI